MSVMKLRNYVNGKWVEAQSNNYLDVENPSTGEIVSRVPLSTPKETAEAILAAHEAYKSWSKTPVSQRVQFLYKFLDLLRKNEKEIAYTLSEEMGKSLPDSYAETKRAIENLEVACGMPILQQGEKLVGAADGIDTEVIRMPMGVFTLIAPFNFPAMVPFWFLPYAIASGNTYVVKPSELVPNTMKLITDFIDESNLPAGVFNLVNGDKSVAEVFMSHSLVQGVSVVGSSRVCRVVTEKCASEGKRFQAMGGAKNHLVVMPDSNLDKVIQNMITSCYGCAGQRCMAASVIVANPHDPKVADEPMVMGPVISANSKKFIYEMIEIGINEGATLALDGRGLVVDGCENGYFVGPTVFTDVKPGMKIHSTEIFGPVVSIMKTDSLDSAIDIINEHQYGNGASIYTQSGFYARKFKMETKAGMIGVNVGIPAPVAYMPFGGMKASLFSDIKAQGKAVINFFTQDKIVTERFFDIE